MKFKIQDCILIANNLVEEILFCLFSYYYINFFFFKSLKLEKCDYVLEVDFVLIYECV